MHRIPFEELVTGADQQSASSATEWGDRKKTTPDAIRPLAKDGVYWFVMKIVDRVEFDPF